MRGNVDDSFKLLEEKIRKAGDRMRQLAAETQSLKTELAKAQGGLQEGVKKLEAAEKRREAAEKAREAAEKRLREGSRGPEREDVEQLESFSREVKQLRREREEIRIRLGKMVDALEGLE